MFGVKIVYTDQVYFYNNDEYSPQKLISYEKSGHPPIQLSKIKCYHNHTIALTTQSELYVWGCNT